MIRINLLPPVQKEEIKWYWVSHHVFFYITVFLTIIGIFITLLFTIQIFLQTELNSLDQKIQSRQKSARSQELKALENQIKALNENVLRLDKIQNEHVYYSYFLENYSQLIPKDIQIFDLDIQKNKESSQEDLYKINMNGKAKTREILLSFKENLEKSENFKDLYLPLSNLTKRYDVDFSLSVFLKAEALRKYQ